MINTVMIFPPFKSPFCENGGCYIYPENVLKMDQEYSVKERIEEIINVLKENPYIGMDCCVIDTATWEELDSSPLPPSPMGHYPLLRMRTVDVMQAMGQYPDEDNLDKITGYNTGGAYGSGVPLTDRIGRIIDYDDDGGGICCFRSDSGCQFHNQSSQSYQDRFSGTPCWLNQIDPLSIVRYETIDLETGLGCNPIVYKVQDEELYLDGVLDKEATLKYKRVLKQVPSRLIRIDCAKAWIPYHAALQEVIEYFKNNKSE